MITSSNTPAIIPDNLVFPPALIFTTVRMVAPAPGKPPNTAAMVFPMPCPTNSLLGLCCVLVMLSATTDVNKESIAPSNANTNAVTIYGATVAISKFVKISKFGDGNPAGISSILA